MKKKSDLLPTSPFALRLAAIMHRQPKTAWDEKREIKPFRALSKHFEEDDLVLVERYYRSNWPPRTGHNHLRHDLATLINNWSGECDRARIWCDAHPVKPAPRKIIPLPLPESDLPPVTVEPETHKKFLADFEASRGRKLLGT